MSYFKLLLISALIILSESILAQCKLDYKVRIDTTLLQKTSSNIELTFQGVPDNVQLKIYDIMDPQFPLLATREIIAGSQNRTISFTNLKNSTYSILATWNGCFENIGGIEGIRINNSKSRR